LQRHKGGEKLQSNITLWQGDCLELMKDIPDGSVDLVLTDPPYKMNHSTGGCTNIGFKNKWSGNIKAGNAVMNFDLSIRFSEWLPEVYRVLKQSGHCYIFCNDKNIQELLNVATGAGFRESNLLVWVKNNATPNRYYMKNCEFVLFLYKGPAKPIINMGSKCCTSVNNINGKDKLHPTEKPIELLSQYICNSSLDGDIVFDPFMGSGSTGVACINTGRNFIGIELDEGYFDIAQKRIAEAQQQKWRYLTIAIT
jgi:site-specific DNA-methyltransferase (adenine-specific)